MNHRYFLILCVAALSLVACDKDDDGCTAPSLSENLVGTWKLSWENSTVEFKADGTLLDANDGLIGGEINGVTLDQKTWLADDSSFEVQAASGAQFLNTTFEVTKNECDLIEVSLLGVTAEMTRQ